MLAVRGRGHFTDDDVADVARLAMAGPIQNADSAAVAAASIGRPFVSVSPL